MANTVQITFQIDQDNQGRTVLRQIDKGLDDIGKSAKQTGSGVDDALGFFKAAVVVEFFRRGVSEAIAFGKTAVDAFNQAKAAALGLESVAKFRGISGEDANNAVNNLELVHKGLLNVGDASLGLKNLLASGFSLPQAIELLKRFGDSAAFGRQGSLSFGQAIVSATEGIKNQNSVLVDNAGVTKNLSVILKERGFELQDISDKVKGAAALEALYQGLLVETQAQVGDAAKLTKEFSGQTAQLDATYQKLLVTLGEIITTNPDLKSAFDQVRKSIETIILQLQDEDSSLRKFVDNAVTGFAIVVDAAGKFLSTLDTIAAIINTITPSLEIFSTNQKLTPEQKATKARFDDLKRQHLEHQKAIDDSNKKITQNAIALTAQETAEKKKALDEITRANEAYFSRLEAANKKFADDQKKLDQSRVDNFKGLIQQGAGLINIQTEIDKLKAGLGGKTNLNEADRARLAAIQRDSLDAQLKQAQEFLKRAENPLQRQLANQQIIAATANIAELTPEQVDIRFRALKDEFAFQQQTFTEQFNRLKEQTTAQKENTLALQAVGNRLAQVDQSLGNFAEKPLTILVEDSTSPATGIDVNLGSVFANVVTQK